MTQRYDLYLHPAPIFDPNNLFGNVANHWALNNIISFMGLRIPGEPREQYQIKLRMIADKDAVWDQVLGNQA